MNTPKTTVRKRLQLTCAITLCMGIFSPVSLYGQSEVSGQMTFELLSSKELPAVEMLARRVVIEEDQKILMGSLSARKGQRVLSIAGRPDVILPHDLPVLVSRDGSMILQYGDPQNLAHPLITDLHWLNAAGTALGSRMEYFRADALVALSDDGFTAVAGTPVEGLQGKVISLFDPGTKQLWERSVGEGREVRAEPEIASGGKRVVVRTTDGEQPLEDHRLLIFDQEGNVLATVASLGIVQRTIALGSGEALFVQCLDQYGLIDLSTGDVRWTRSGKLRLVAPRAAATSPKADLLFLLFARERGKETGTYLWRLTALDAATGDPVADWDLPRAMPGTRTDVFGRVTDKRIEILFGGEQLSVSLSR